MIPYKLKKNSKEAKKTYFFNLKDDKLNIMIIIE